MKIHTDLITAGNLIDATRAAGMRAVDIEYTSHGSRQRARSFNVKLTGSSTRRPNPGTRPGGHYELEGQYAATWDEWGMFIQALYEIDPEAIIGQYPNKAVFEQVTRERFVSLTAPYQHGGGGHKWIVRTPGVQECKFCEASFSWMELHMITRELKEAKKTPVTA